MQEFEEKVVLEKPVAGGEDAIVSAGPPRDGRVCMCAFHLAFQLPLLLLLLLLPPPTGDLGTTCYTSHRMLWRR